MIGNAAQHVGKPSLRIDVVEFRRAALVAGFDDFAVMGQPVEECGRHLGVAEFARTMRFDTMYINV